MIYRPKLRTSTLRVRDGTWISYAHLPNPGAPRIALLHSLAMDHRFWLPLISELNGEAEVLAIDCRGHGASDKATGPYSVALFAEDLGDIFAELEWPDALVAGASMGGAVALQFAIAYPELTSALALIDTTAWYGPTAQKDWADRATKAQAEGLDALTDFQVTRWFSDAFRAQHPDIVKFCVDTFVANKPEAYASTCQMLGDFDLRSDLETLSLPTTILVGEEDYATPISMAQVLNEGISGSTLEVLKGGRHLTPLEFPRLIATRLLSLARVSLQ